MREIACERQNPLGARRARRFLLQQTQQARRRLKRVHQTRPVTRALKRGAPAARAGIQHNFSTQKRLQVLKNAGMKLLTAGQFLIQFRGFPVGQFPEEQVEQLLAGPHNLALWHYARDRLLQYLAFARREAGTDTLYHWIWRCVQSPRKLFERHLLNTAAQDLAEMRLLKNQEVL